MQLDPCSSLATTVAYLMNLRSMRDCLIKQGGQFLRSAHEIFSGICMNTHTHTHHKCLTVTDHVPCWNISKMFTGDTGTNSHVNTVGASWFG